MERVVAISCDEYITLGDVGAWVYGYWLKESPPEPSEMSDTHVVSFWELAKRSAKNGTYTVFYTKVSDDV